MAANNESAAKTALQAGHSEEMLFGHYREIVTAETAAEFWELTPERCAELAVDAPVPKSFNLTP